MPSAQAPAVRWFTNTSILESIGDSVARNLLPIVAVTILGAGIGTVGLLNSLGLVAFLVLGLPIGVLADRWPLPTWIMTVSTTVRAAVVLGAVGAWASGLFDGVVGLGILIAVALIVGVADVAYTSGQGLLVPRIVEPDEIRPLFGRAQAAGQVGGVVGSLLLSGGLAVVAAPLLWCVSGASYLGSVVTQRRIRPIQPAVARVPRESMWRQARNGLGLLVREPTLRRITIANTLHNAAVMAANTLVPVVALSSLSIAPSVYALLGIASALAGIGGAASAATITARLGLRMTRALCGLGIITGVLAVMSVDFLPGPAELWIGIQIALAAVCGPIALVAGADLPAKLSPPERLGAVMGAQRTVVLGIMPIAAVAIGALGSAAGVDSALRTWLALAVAAVIPCLFLGREPATE
ncbi:MFS-type transporter involved in bile tolerance, Atg22 family [Ruaniaceae bacterium KH17]|nr:MFS-type transporter involved in bile tolerance, Atg22 family [Ruaniaceae bacterium KH17]